MINCPNPSCKTANPEDREVCQVCQTALPHYYLWGVGDLVSTLKVNSLVNQRYLLKRDHTFLDTKPGLVPESPPDLPAFLTAYLHLSAYPLHVPRVYSVMKTPDGDYLTLLESSALAVSSDNPDAGSDSVPALLPELSSQWKHAPPLRQLSWLWQIAQLWEPFSQEQVAATLLDEALLRVDGSIVRLLSLTSGKDATGEAKQPTLIDLGLSWRSLAEKSNQAVRAFLERLCEQLERQQLSAEQLSERLSAAIAVCGQGQAVNYDLAVYTDQGPTRKRNEDACYPESGTAEAVSAEQTKTDPQLLIVCDGIGGHQGGDVASKLAIETIRTELAPLLDADAPDLSSTALALAIEEAICAANDEISAQNDQAKRQARDRMGTTLVLALIKGADVYIAHLGDSRAYRISQQNCQQVTLDDDVASRQVRLAGGLYREALTQPGSGSLIQALGMGPSHTLRPTVQRFVMDEDCVFLLCSDGLSDSDRVEQFWQSVLRPIAIESAPSVADVGQQLVDIANKYNGHDNVTVGLIGVRVALPSERMVPRELATRPMESEVEGAPTANVPTEKKRLLGKTRSQTGLVPLEAAPTQRPGVVATDSSQATRTNQNSSLPTKGQKVSVPKESKGGAGFAKAAIALLILAGAGGLLYFLLPSFSDRFSPSVTSSSGGLESLNGEGAQTEASPTTSVPVDLSEGAYVRIRRAGITQPERTINPPITDDEATATPGISDSEALPAEAATQILLYPNPEDGTALNAVPYTIPVGGIAEIVESKTVGSEDWVQLAVCTVPSGDLSETPVEGSAPVELEADPAPLAQNGVPFLSPGTQGWASSLSLNQFAEGVVDLPLDQRGSCGGE